MKQAIYIIIIILAFIFGQAHQFKVDESKVNQALESTIQCDGRIPSSDLQYGGEIAEFDCLTPEAYQILNTHFFQSPISDSNLVKIGANNLW